MRATPLAAVALLAFASPVRAQWAVIDAANLEQSVQHVYQGAQQIAQLTQQLAVMRQQYMQLLYTYQAIAHLPDQVLSEAAATFQVPSLRSPVPGLASDLNSIVGGMGGGTLSATINGLATVNRIFSPTGYDAHAIAMNTNAASIAGTQAMAQQLYQSATDHAAALWTLESKLSSSPDAKTTADIQARLQMEQAHLQARVVQAQTLGAAQSAQVRQTAQQHEESRRCYIEALLNGTAATADTCAKAASFQIASASATGGDANGSVATGYDQYLGQSVGTGQCVALVEAADPSLGRTANWTQGAQVQGNMDLAPGTAIATFDGSGKYANATDGSSHAAIYLGQDGNGNIQVQDQWLGHAASVRTIYANGNTQANSASAFYVIGSASGQQSASK